MHWVGTVLQVIAALGLLNVWILRFGRKTPFRGGDAGNMREEFTAYGLPGWVMWVVGALKVAIAMGLLAGIWLPALVRPAAVVLIILMLTAFVMHLKVKDPFVRSLPSLAMLALAVAIFLF